MEKSLWLCMEASRGAHQSVGTSSGHQWGPLAFTVCSKHSLQRGPSNGLNGDFGSFGKTAFRIAAPLVMKFNSLVVAASFTLFARVPVAMAESHQHGALGKARRKRLRATIGLLRDRLIAPRTSLDSGFLQLLFHGRLPQTTHSYRNGSPPL